MSNVTHAPTTILRNAMAYSASRRKWASSTSETLYSHYTEYKREVAGAAVVFRPASEKFGWLISHPPDILFLAKFSNFPMGLSFLYHTYYSFLKGWQRTNGYSEVVMGG
ncbi:hypothetical protein EVAR_77902_1 [Eumeta japonica]|uniref:Uncharacterized protein n=1 Tax=Eumeta variegata TaxID=151549 RepID=A0A4C1ZDF0_EUMVA|nr:hypothetical protein EVAR_77902_1 [Eumeta japonica]